jgi:hypothetical protein
MLPDLILDATIGIVIFSVAAIVTVIALLLIVL